MLEVTIWFGNHDGDGAQSYLINVDVESIFDTEPHLAALRTATAEFMKEQPRATISRIDLRRTPHRVIAVTERASDT